jgi:2,3-diketo-5-methylthio-1-phosphopentane phosphatase
MDSLVRTFCGEKEWGEIESKLLQREITLYEVMQNEIDLLKISEDQFDTFIVENIDLTPRFKEFLSWISTKNIDFLVISGGFDRTINLIFKKFRIKSVKYYANKVSFSQNRMNVEFPFFNDECGKCPSCKDMIFRGCHKIYRRVIVIGDGLSDCCVARRADLVYAKSYLAKFCEENDISYIPYNDFEDIISSLSTLIEEGESEKIR